MYNNLSTRMQKSNRDGKFKNCIVRIWRNRNKAERSRLRKCNRNPIKHSYIDNLNTLHIITNFLLPAQMTAGQMKTDILINVFLKR